MSEPPRTPAPADGARRLRRLPVREVLGHRVPVACGPLSRLLGLAHLDRARAGTGLLLPRCRSVHTFGMRFPLDLYWLDGGGEVVRVDRGVPPWRISRCGRARAVIEMPSPASRPGA